MSNLFLSPHSDDEALFGSFIIQRSKADVMIVTDGYQHQRKFRISIDTRRNESRQACKILGAKVNFLGLTDEYNQLTEDMILDALMIYRDIYKIIFAPITISGAHIQHNMVSKVAQEIWGNNVLYYGIYAPGTFMPKKGEMAIYGTQEEIKMKNLALQCYISQIKINEPFFINNQGATEYLSFQREYA